MSNISRYLQPGENIDHTPAAAVYAGNILLVGNNIAFSSHDIAAGVLGAVATSGVIRGPFVGGLVANPGDNIWWDANGTKYDSGVADGAFTVVPQTENLDLVTPANQFFWAGTLVAKTSATGDTCDIALNKVNPALPAWREKAHILMDTGAALTAADHSGGVVHVTATAQTITLPNGVAGMEFIIQNDVADAGSIILIDPTHATEDIEGANLTVADTELAELTKLTSIRGDYVHLVCNVAAASWRCIAKRGIWIQAA